MKSFSMIPSPIFESLGESDQTLVATLNELAEDKRKQRPNITERKLAEYLADQMGYRGRGNVQARCVASRASERTNPGSNWVYTSNAKMIARCAGIVAATVLCGLGALHAYWAGGGRWGAQVAIPRRSSGEATFVPGSTGTLTVLDTAIRRGAGVARAH